MPTRQGWQGGCARSTIGALKLERIVWEQVREVIENPGVVRLIVEKRREELKETGTLADVERLNKRLDALETERHRTVSTFAKGYIDEGELDIRMRSISERQKMVAEEIERMRSHVGDYDAQLEALDNFTAVATAIRNRLPLLDDDERRELICAIVSRVTVGPEINLTMAIGHAPVIDDLKARWP